MTWYSVGAAIIYFILLLNFGVFLLRAKAAPEKHSSIKRVLPPSEIGIYLAMAAVWVGGFALPYVWPDTQWGQAMGRPWALFSLGAWSMLLGVVLVGASHIAHRRSRR